MSMVSNELRTIEIETQRLILRQPLVADAPAMAILADDKELAAMTARLPHPYSIAAAHAFVADRARRNALGDGLALAIEDQMTGAFIGIIGLDPRDNGDTDIDYWLGRPFWGRGFATESARALIDHGFAAMELDAIVGVCRVTNETSRRVLEKCGFRYVTSGLALAPARGGAVPVDRFRLTRRNWDSFKAWRPATVRPRNPCRTAPLETVGC